jgi:hypothetical protein
VVVHLKDERKHTQNESTEIKKLIPRYVHFVILLYKDIEYFQGKEQCKRNIELPRILAEGSNRHRCGSPKFVIS